jgi:hypothetical protein
MCNVLIFDFFSGTGSATKPFTDAGHTVVTFELSTNFTATEHVDISTLTSDYLIRTYGIPDFIWASPPCTTFSVASISHHWVKGGCNPQPRTDDARLAQELVAHTLSLIKELNPINGWLLENPRGMLRKLPVVKGYKRETVTYCTYGDNRMKPTDLWGDVPNWTPRHMCSNGMSCHESAPRGAKTGTQGLRGTADRSRVPYELGQELLNTMSRAS